MPLIGHGCAKPKRHLQQSPQRARCVPPRGARLSRNPVDLRTASRCEPIDCGGPRSLSSQHSLFDECRQVPSDGTAGLVEVLDQVPRAHGWLSARPLVGEIGQDCLVKVSFCHVNYPNQVTECLYIHYVTIIYSFGKVEGSERLYRQFRMGKMVRSAN